MLLGFLGWRLTLFLSEETIMLRPQGFDPRDPFRGDYAVLRYNESFLSLAAMGARAEDFPENGDIFVVMAPGTTTHRAVRVSFDEPSTSGDESCMRGRVTSASSSRSSVSVEYGIESFFVPEGRGLEVEKAIREQRALVHVKSGPFCAVAIEKLLIDGAPWP